MASFKEIMCINLLTSYRYYTKYSKANLATGFFSKKEAVALNFESIEDH
jgi:hypothetical protein